MSRILSGFKYNGEKFSDIEDFSILIELMFDNIGYEYNQDYNSYKEYYLCYNPFGDGNIKSATIYHKDGNMLIYNDAIELIRDGKKIKVRSITITEYHRMLGLLGNYIDFILLKYGISPLVINEYRELLSKSMTGFSIDYKKKIGFDNFRRFLFNFYITDKDVLNLGKVQTRDKIKEKFCKPIKVKEDKPKPKINKEIGFFDKKLVERYIRDRKIYQSKNMFPVIVEFNNGTYKSPALCMEYPSGFKKIRMINRNSKLRYFASSEEGSYDNLFEVRVNNTKECYICEGEIEGATIAQYIEEDIFSLHNTNALPVNKLTQLNKYDKINVLIDYDTYEKVSKMIEDRLKEEFPNKEINVRPKFICEDKSVDFNSYHIKGLLNIDCIYKPKLVV